MKWYVQLSLISLSLIYYTGSSKGETQQSMKHELKELLSRFTTHLAQEDGGTQQAGLQWRQQRFRCTTVAISSFESQQGIDAELAAKQRHNRGGTI